MARILILWNQIDDDVYEHYRRDGRRAPDWDPTLEVEPWETVEQEIELIEGAHRRRPRRLPHQHPRQLREPARGGARDPVDCVVNLAEFFHDDPEQEHNCPGAVRAAQHPLHRQSPLALSLCQKKPQAKALLGGVRPRTPRGIVIEQWPGARDLDLRYPMMVKPVARRRLRRHRRRVGGP